jgi:hypothetical protein
MKAGSTVVVFDTGIKYLLQEWLFVRSFQEKSVRPCLGTRDFVFDADMSVFGRELGERA